MTNLTIEEIKKLYNDLQNKDWFWDGRTVSEEGYIYHPQCSYLSGTNIMLSDTYEDDYKDLDFIKASPQIAKQLIDLYEKIKEMILSDKTNKETAIALIELLK